MDATPELRVGCKPISINGEPVDGMAFKEAAPLTKVRPLESSGRTFWSNGWFGKRISPRFRRQMAVHQEIKEHSLGATAAVESR